MDIWMYRTSSEESAGLWKEYFEIILGIEIFTEIKRVGG